MTYIYIIRKIFIVTLYSYLYHSTNAWHRDMKSEAFLIQATICELEVRVILNNLEYFSNCAWVEVGLRRV